MPVYQQEVEGYPIALEIWGARVGKIYNAAEKTSNFYQVTWKGTEHVVSYTLTKPTKVDLTTDGKVLTDADYGYHLVDGQARFANLVFNAVEKETKNLPVTYQADSRTEFGKNREIAGRPQIRQLTTSIDPVTGKVMTNTEIIDQGQAPKVIKGTKTKVTETSGEIPVVYRGDESQARDYRREEAGVAPVTKVATQYTMDSQTGQVTATETSQEIAGKAKVITLGTAPRIDRQAIAMPKVYEADSSLPYESKVETAGVEGEIITKMTDQVNEKTGEVAETMTTSRTEPKATVIRVGNQEVTTRPIGITTRYIQDDNLEMGQELTVQAGREGVKQLTRTYQVNAQDGSLSQPSVLSEIKTVMEERVIKVGTKTPAAPSEDKLPEAPIASTTSKEILPYKQVVEEDDSLDKGKQYVRVTGQNGKREVTTYQTILDGQVVTETSKVTSETPAVDEVLVVGTKDISSVSEISPSQESLPEAPITSKTNEEELPYKQVIEEDSNLEKGKQFVRVKGQNGKRQIMTYQTIVDGQVAAETSKVTSETPAVDEVLVVGTKDISSLPNETPLPSPREEWLTEHSNCENGKKESLTKMDNLSKCHQLSQIL